MDPRTQHLTPAEAARRLGVHPRTLVRWSRAGVVTPYTTPGGQRRYPSEQLDRLMERRQTDDRLDR